MSQTVTYCYDQSLTQVYRRDGDTLGRQIQGPQMNSEWNREEVTHSGGCEVGMAVSIWLEVKDGMISEAASSAENLGTRAKILCEFVKGMTVEEVKKMLDSQPAGQSATMSAVMAALAAALASGEQA